MKNKPITKKQSLIRTLFDGMSFLLAPLGAMLVVAGVVLGIYADLTGNKTLAMIIFHIYCLVPLSIVVLFSLAFAIVYALDLIKAANRIRYLPLTKSEFNDISANMTLTECLNWLDKTICFGGFDDSDYVFPAFRKSRYAGYILQYYLFAYEKYKDSKPLKDEETPDILFYREEDIWPVNCEEAGIVDSLGFKNYYDIRSKLKEFYGL